jgi:hypothetical protein
MSFDIFLQCGRDGQMATWKREVVDEIFGQYVVHREDTYGFVRLEFPDGGGSVVYMGNEDDIDGMTFNRGGGLNFFQELYRLTDRIQGCLFWPGPFFVITDAATLNHVPAGLHESGFAPLLVRSGAEIVAAIKRS